MYLYGASGHGKVVLEIAEMLNLDIQGFVDNDSAKKEVLGYEVIHNCPENAEIILSLGNNKTRKSIVEKSKNVTYKSVIHPKSVVSHRTSIAEGTVVMAGVVINTSVIIGKHTIINTNASVDHDCHIGDYVHISPNVSLAGNVMVKEGAHIGIGSTVIQGVTVGKWSIIGAGAVVIKDVPDYAVVVGNPAKIIKYNKD